MKLLKNTYLHYSGTTLHKLWVFYYCFKFSIKLIIRGIVHDFSKYSISESLGFIKVIDKLKHLTYGSQEYIESLKSIQPSINHHYTRNSHHPEYYPNRIDDMNLLDIVEMICDWQAAVKRHNDGDIDRSIKINGDRFKLDLQLINIIKNSVKK